VNKLNVYLFLNDVWRPVQIDLALRRKQYELQLLSNESFVATEFIINNKTDALKTDINFFLKHGACAIILPNSYWANLYIRTAVLDKMTCAVPFQLQNSVAFSASSLCSSFGSVKIILNHKQNMLLNSAQYVVRWQHIGHVIKELVHAFSCAYIELRTWESLETTKEARVALGYRLEKLLPFFHALQTFRVHPYLDPFFSSWARNWTNPANLLVPEAGGIFSSGPPQRAESVEVICFRKRISGQSFSLFTLP